MDQQFAALNVCGTSFDVGWKSRCNDFRELQKRGLLASPLK